VQNSSNRTPYHKMPITIVRKAIAQPYYRKMHCVECGWPIADITDKVVMIMDGNTPLDRLEPNSLGITEVHCHRHQCKQYYRMEFAV
jgi:hypothetical protein